MALQIDKNTLTEGSLLQILNGQLF